MKLIFTDLVGAEKEGEKGTKKKPQRATEGTENEDVSGGWLEIMGEMFALTVRIG